jgi:hypothetical protein
VVAGSGERITLGEEIKGAVAAQASKLQRAEYYKQYGKLYEALKKAGPDGLTLQEAEQFLPGISSMSENALWETIGRMSNGKPRSFLGWLFLGSDTREVGLWKVFNPLTNSENVVINAGTASRVLAPRSLAEGLVSHLGHVHPSGYLRLQRTDRDLLKLVESTARKGDYTARTGIPIWIDQQAEIILVGPTGQWRRVQIGDLLK